MNSLKRNIYIFLRENMALIFVTALVFVIGAVSGGVFACGEKSDVMPEIKEAADRYFSVASLQTLSRNMVFLYGIGGALRCIVILFLSGFCIFLLPLAAVQIFAEGFKTGFLIFCFAALYGAKGMVLPFGALIFRMFLYIPALIFLSVCCIRHAAAKWGGGKKRYIPARLRAEYFCTAIAVILAAAAVCFAESRIAPTLFSICGTIF